MCVSCEQEVFFCVFLHLDVDEQVPVPLPECGEEVIDLPPHDYPKAQHQASYHREGDGHQQVYEEGHECPAGEGYDHEADADHV